MNNTILLVPVHLDALFLASETAVANPVADFSGLPFFDGRTDVHPDTPYLSEHILASAFVNDFVLANGVHLHWALPDALTSSIPNTAQAAGQTATIEFPAVPNRWLISRSRNNNIDKQWVVESDYLFAPNENPPNLMTPVAYPLEKQHPTDTPFRYMGRAQPIEQYRKDTNRGSDYLHQRPGHKLTAVGYGEPTFAAFYPNCHSVFGFHDESIETIPDGLSYQIVGWYSSGAGELLTSEYFQQSLAQIKSGYTHVKKTPPPDQDPRFETLRRQFGLEIDRQLAGDKWNPVKVKKPTTFPKWMLCYAQIELKTSAGSDNQNIKPEQVTVAIGNSQTEALSAYLAYDGTKKIKDKKKRFAKKRRLEEQIESIHLSSQMEGQTVDIGMKFLEARHSKGFTGIGEAILWSIRRVDAADLKAHAHRQAEPTTLPTILAHLLNRLNLCQLQRDRTCFQIRSLQRRIYSDWAKYMEAAYPADIGFDEYPEIDSIKEFIEREIDHELVQLQRTLVVDTDNLEHAKRTVEAEIVRVNQRVGDKAPPYKLQAKAGPRYWQPQEPVVLLVGDGDTVKATPRHDADGLVGCQLLTMPALPKVDQVVKAKDPAKLPAIMDQVVKAADHATLEKVLKQIRGLAKRDVSRKPWNPFMLEWQVMHFAARRDSNLASDSPDYAEGFLRDNFVWPAAKDGDGPFDLHFKDSSAQVVKHPSVYDGRSYLTPHATKQLSNQLETFLVKQLTKQGYQQPIDPSNREKREKVKDWLKDRVTKANQAATKARSQPHEAKRLRIQADRLQAWLEFVQFLLDEVHPQLDAGKLNSLGQSLSGFNNALLMHRQVYQLPVDDPLAFPQYKLFADKVARAVGRENHRAPESQYDFQPLRSGTMYLSRLRLIDTFGQVRDLDVQKTIVNNVMTAPEANLMNEPNKPPLVILPPRLMQPARLNLRWLSALDDDLEMNDHPATSPICGWVAANYLDNSLQVYDQNGQGLGIIDFNGHWHIAPGSPLNVARPEQIANAHLRATAMQICQHCPVNSFISVLASALHNIEPASLAQHQGVSLLMGQPLAVVRAFVELELQGLPEISHDWINFRQDLRKRRGLHERQTDGFEKVAIPVRLGEHAMLNDGLVGYWLDNGDSTGRIANTFFSPQADAATDTGDWVTVYKSTQPPLHLKLNGSPQKLTMLFDPRGKLHATTGVLPTKVIDLPADQYRLALETMQVSFRAMPILTAKGEIELPLPAEPGYEWHWTERNKTPEHQGRWQTPQRVVPASTDAHFKSPQEIKEGWLLLQKQNKQSDHG